MATFLRNGGGLVALVAALFLTLIGVGCVPALEEQRAFLCSEAAPCPAGMRCGAEGRCVLEESDAEPDLGDVDPDGSVEVDAPELTEVDTAEPCDCEAHETCCDGACVDLLRSGAHCGACGEACLGEASCVAGMCRCAVPEGMEVRECGPTERCCRGVGCVDVVTSAAACGRCGVKCNPGESCAGGLCRCGAGEGCGPGLACCDGVCCGAGESCCGGVCEASTSLSCSCGGSPCPDGWLCCPGIGGVVTCVDPDLDPNHCGGCGRACPNNALCGQGQCECALGFADCTATPGCETQIARDAKNCGGCGRVCGPGTQCVEGQCMCPVTGTACAPGEACCQAGCVDTDAAVAHCGACGGACPSQAPQVAEVSCEDGACVFSCAEGYANCDGMLGTGCESLLATDDENCGRCGRSCGEGRSCSSGKCECFAEPCDCSADQTLCDEACVDVESSAEHCGGCGRVCGEGQTCEAGHCVCPVGRVLCQGRCVEVRTDSSNCGECGRACLQDGNVFSASCLQGRCSYVCASGYGDCTPEPGCETHFATNADHCGACNRACPAGQVCVNGACRCPAGYAGPEGCDGGCVDVLNSAQACGSCGAACPEGYGCIQGECRCEVGAAWCDGVCTETLSDGEHCGACFASCGTEVGCANGLCWCDEGGVLGTVENCGVCGQGCAEGAVCASARCQCPVGQQPCNGVCEDLRAAREHCGACGNDCGAFLNVDPATVSCVNGTCAFTCIEPYGNCVASQPGCETHLLTSVSHCGACGVNCSALTSVTNVSCSQGQCQFSCLTNWADCDPARGGCETNTSNNSLHCGGCNRPCASGSVCQSGNCVIP